MVIRCCPTSGWQPIGKRAANRSACLLGALQNPWAACCCNDWLQPLDDEGVRRGRFALRQQLLRERGARHGLPPLLRRLLLQRRRLRLPRLPWRRLLRLGLRRRRGQCDAEALRLRARQFARRGADKAPSRVLGIGVLIGQPSGPFLRGPFGGKSFEMLTLTGAPHTQLRSIFTIASSASSRSVNVMKEYVSVSECLIVMSWMLPYREKRSYKSSASMPRGRPPTQTRYRTNAAIKFEGLLPAYAGAACLEP